jgi:hypothetical protein
MRRIIVLLTAGAMMAVMLVAGTIPAFAAPGGGATVFDRQCTEQPSGDTVCSHKVATPPQSGVSNDQAQTSGGFFAREGGAEQGTAKVPGEFVGHSTIAPTGNFNTITHQNPPTE